jgi:hypothetical protein
MRKTHLWPEETVEANGSTTVSVTIESSDRDHASLWYRVPSEYAALIPSSCDSFAVATLMLAMSQSTDVVVHGEVSPSLLRNLEEFQSAWVCWCPQKYQKIEITAEVEREQLSAAPEEKAIAAFSGGVDSCFTVFRHKAGRAGRLTRNLQAGLMVHGFDIPLAQQQVFERAEEKSRAILASLGVELITMTTNFRELPQDWEDVFGAAVASALMLLRGGYTIGLLPSSYTYQSLFLPWGSNPLTDPLLSSHAFQIIHDGIAFKRIEKIRELTHFPAALQGLRVCWEGEQLDRNCGRCEKCIRTILGFRVMGIGLPSCFEQDVTERQILDIHTSKKSQITYFEEILEIAKENGISDSWVSTLEECIKRNQRSVTLKQSSPTLRERLPSTLRGRLRQVRSLLSRK